MAIDGSGRTLRTGAHAATLALFALPGGGAVAATPPPDIVAVEMKVTLDHVSAAQAAIGDRKIGDVDRIELVFDAKTLDQRSKRVKLLNFQHLTQGEYRPATPDATVMPMDDAWLDTAARPYRLHFHAAVIHGEPIVIDVDETSRRLTIHRQNRPQDMEISGPYVIDPTWLRSAAITRAGAGDADGAAARR